MLCSCIFCKLEFSVKGIHTHVERSHLGSKKYSSGFNGKYDIFTVRAKEKYEEQKINTKVM